MRRAATATAVAVNASRRGGSRYPCTDRSARARTHTSRRRVTVDANLAGEIPRSARRRREESVAGRGSRAGDRCGIVGSPFGSSPATKKRLRHRASRLRRRYSRVIVGAFGLLHREWREVAKEAAKLALIEAGDSSHAHPGGSCKRSTAVKEKETKREKEGKNGVKGEAGKAIGIYTYIEEERERDRGTVSRENREARRSRAVGVNKRDIHTAAIEQGEASTARLATEWRGATGARLPSATGVGHLAARRTNSIRACISISRSRSNKYTRRSYPRKVPTPLCKSSA